MMGFYFICLDPDCRETRETVEEIVNHIDTEHPEIRKMLDETEGSEENG